MEYSKVVLYFPDGSTHEFRHGKHLKGIKIKGKRPIRAEVFNGDEECMDNVRMLLHPVIGKLEKKRDCND